MMTRIPITTDPDDYQRMLVRELAKRSKNLAELLESPEPGLFTWSQMVAENAQFISDWWAGKLAMEKK